MNSLKYFHTHEQLEKIYLKHIYHSFAIGTDNISHNTFNKNLHNEIEIIYRKLNNRTYKFTRYKLNLLNKGRQKYPREIYIPTIRDRIVLKTIHLFLQDYYSLHIENKLPQVIIKDIATSIKDYDSYIKIDIKNFYPSINHNKLFLILKENIECEYTLEMIKKSLQPPKNEIIGGIPQGLAISNILANIFLISIDKNLKNTKNIKYFRYVDDILVLCNYSNIEELKAKINTLFKELLLEIHPISKNSKSKVGSIALNKFDYLGYSFENGKISVRNSTINNLHTSIIQCFTKYKYSKNKNIEFLIFQLNLKITGCIDDGKAKGWLFFFSQINNLTILKKLDFFIKHTWEKFGIEPNYFLYIKSFSKAYFEIRYNFKNSTYFYNFDNFNLAQKIKILEEIFNTSTNGMFESEINDLFRIKTKGQINKLLIDLKNFS
ncbi:reverse transcriptase/maturase family protein [Acinetobacter lwoffii]|uniref:reverse transcriptase/maturase family protein n=1 Tax=Acinetobacter lwoffii TaxID=28090 RepID=UPI001FF12825|nr:reverse transcriptase/maturase family protein [Acinetobacter lwoffii]MCJ8511290.1 reverse transcriptase/maturase family protein [Acinetobacter lwoffii]